MINLQPFRVKRLILHEVFERRASQMARPPALANELAVIDPEHLAVIEQRIVQSIGNGSYCYQLAVDDTKPGRPFQICAQMVGCTDDDFILGSRLLAHELVSAQRTARIPGGLLLVASGEVGPKNERFTAVLKCELQDGFSKHTIEESPQLRFIDNLVLTPYQKLFKVGFFLEKRHNTNAIGMRDKTDFDVFLFDHNLNWTRAGIAAQYFREHFLGLGTPEDSAMMVLAFYNASRDFISGLPLDPIRKYELTDQLWGYVCNENNGPLHMRTFALRVFDSPNEQDEYYAYLESKGIPNRNIERDLTLIRKKPVRHNVLLGAEQAIKLSFPPSRSDDVIIEHGLNGKVIITVLNTISRESI